VLDGFTAEDDADGHAQDTDQEDTENHCKRKDKQAHGVLIAGFVQMSTDSHGIAFVHQRCLMGAM
jgi:hypothetical protein